MDKVKYIYEFSEQIKLKKGLQRGDKAIIASKLGVSENYIGMMLTGTRKMTKEVRQEIERLTELNKQKTGI